MTKNDGGEDRVVLLLRYSQVCTPYFIRGHLSPWRKSEPGGCVKYAVMHDCIPLM